MFTLHTTEPEAANFEPADVRRQGVFHESRGHHPVVSLKHTQTGACNAELEHRVAIWSGGTLLADIPGAKAAYQWLRDRGYTCIVGLNGVWRRG